MTLSLIFDTLIIGVEKMTFYRKQHYLAKPLVKQDNLKARLAKLQKEDLDNRSKEFVESVAHYYKMKGGLTEGQLGYFEKIESRFSPQEKVKLKEWAKEYKKDYFTAAKIVANYYLNTGYYTVTATSILNDELFIPTKKQTHRMIGNKYAQLVLENHYKEPKFEKGQLVQVRTQAGSHTKDPHLRRMGNRLCFVLENTLPIVNAVKGGKRYNLLPMGESNAIVADERNLIKPNKKGKNS